MTSTPPPAPPAGPAGEHASPGDAAPRPAEFAVSASIGPVPAVFAARSPDGTAAPVPDAPGLLGRALARALHLAGRRAGPRRPAATTQPGHDPGGNGTGERS
ncbi:MAG TPA: hypothetical protein VFV41_00690 [Streptosporangiaceae bacterium]|nr:hypothetical protein [Streptosporangiaceae bacterium]